MTEENVAVIEVDVDFLMLSPEETRKTVNESALKDLAASIEKQGVIEPILIRPLRGFTIFLDKDDVIDSPPVSREEARRWFDEYRDNRGAEVDDRFCEIVAGQRRWRASQLAGKKTVPAIMRDMSDAEARQIRLVSNLQRENLPSMEEAQGFANLLSADGATVESIGAILGKAPSFIGRRLKLLDAVEPVQEALRAEAIEVGHALELARLDRFQQRKLLAWLDVGFQVPDDEDPDDVFGGDESGVCKFCDCDEDNACKLPDGPCHWMNGEQTVCSNPECIARWKDPAEQKWNPTRYSLAELKAQIGRMEFRLLNDAPFPLDANMPPANCAECPKRSVNTALLFSDFSQDTCTDRTCYDEKCKVWVKGELKDADERHEKLLTVSYDYPSQASVLWRNHVSLIPPSDDCQSAERAIWINGPHAGHRVYICRDPKCSVHKGRRVPPGAATSAKKKTEKEKLERSNLLAKVCAEKNYRASLYEKIANAPGPDLQKAMDQMATKLAAYAIRRSDSTKAPVLAEATGISKDVLTGWNVASIEAELAKRPAHVRLMIALLAVNSGSLTVSEQDYRACGSRLPKERIGIELMAELVGIDWQALRKSFAPKVQKPAKKAAAKKSAPVKTKAAAKGRKISSEMKKKIVANMQKRWAAKKPGLTK